MCTLDLTAPAFIPPCSTCFEHGIGNDARLGRKRFIVTLNENLLLHQKCIFLMLGWSSMMVLVVVDSSSCNHGDYCWRWVRVRKLILYLYHAIALPLDTYHQQFLQRKLNLILSSR